MRLSLLADESGLNLQERGRGAKGSCRRLPEARNCQVPAKKALKRSRREAILVKKGAIKIAVKGAGVSLKGGVFADHACDFFRCRARAKFAGIGQQ